MKKYKLILIFLFQLIIVAFSKQLKNDYTRAENTYYSIKNTNRDSLNSSISIHKPIIYLDDEVDTIIISKSWRNKCLTFHINTFRDYRKFLSFFKKEFGSPKYSLGSNLNDSTYQFGKYFWKHKTAFGLKDLELTLRIDDDYGSFSINCSIWSEKMKDISNDSIITQFFTEACKTKLFNQKVIYKLQTGNSHIEKHFDLQEIIHKNYDSLIHIFERSIKLTDEKVELKLTINEKGKIQEKEITGNQEIKKLLEQFINQTEFPVLIYKQSKDRIKYNLSWEFWISDETFLNRAKSLIKSGINNYLPTNGFNQNRFYISYGDFFKTGRKIYVVRNPYGKLISFLDLENGEFKELYLANDSDNERYIDMDIADLNNDTLKEIIIQTPPNMNGNRWKEVYAYNKSTAKVYHAGSYCTNDTRNKKKNEIYVEYGGSWYMPTSKTVLGWKNGLLITKRFIEISLKECDYSGDDKQIMEYYENPYFDIGKDTLVIQKMDWYSVKYDKLWDDFFITVNTIRKK
ncbi:MAG: hypothetical protein ACOYO1_16235 [Bacteroidales bacterium]